VVHNLLPFQGKHQQRNRALSAAYERRFEITESFSEDQLVAELGLVPASSVPCNTRFVLPQPNCMYGCEVLRRRGDGTYKINVPNIFGAARLCLAFEQLIKDDRCRLAYF
jgi:hypothetical protein